MSQPPLDRLVTYLRDRHPRAARNIDEARAAGKGRFEPLLTLFLGWLVGVRGEEGIEQAADAFVQFSTDVNLAQARYEVEGHYPQSSFADAYLQHYSRPEAMNDYLWGIFLTNCLWAHHTEISLFYHDSFLTRLNPSARLIEIAPGHGGWGVWALTVLPDATLRGYDVSPSAVTMATQLSRAAGVAARASYHEQNALELTGLPAACADAVVCCFLLEHLERPADLVAAVAHLLPHNGLAFLTGALTAAQLDHIYEFHHESELVRLCEEQGLRALATLSTAPRRTLPRARYLPRSMALIVQKWSRATA